MHEMALLRNVVDIVLDEVAGTDIVSVKKVVLAVGDMRDVVDAFVPGLFKRLARGTVAQDAEVEIIHVPVTARCKSCGFVLPIDVHDKATWTCPSCHAEKGFRIVTGNEFIVQSLEVAAMPAAGGRERVA